MECNSVKLHRIIRKYMILYALPLYKSWLRTLTNLLYVTFQSILDWLNLLRVTGRPAGQALGFRQRSTWQTGHTRWPG